MPRSLRQLGFGALTAPRARRCAAALHDPARVQAATLDQIVRRVAGAEYARALGLRAGQGYDRFAERVPIVEYEDLWPWIERQAERGDPALTTERPVVYERTSGSSGRAKLVPYPASLLAAFNSWFLIWAHDVAMRGPAFTTGRLFFSVSPAVREAACTPSGVPVSLADDAAYLAPWVRRLLSKTFFVSPVLKRIADGGDYRRALATVLVAEARLAIVSVWSPTYLLALLDTIADHRETIAADLTRGRTGAPGCEVALPAVTPGRIALLWRNPIPWDALWPHLALLSCWTDGASAAFVPSLRRAFPGVPIQGKGLLATEAPMTVPLLRAPAPVPLLDEVFFEFESADGTLRRLHQLADGAEYSVIVTQSGGFLRYRTHDRVRVEGRVGRTPCLRFLGRAGRGCDLAGEKLGEAHARAALVEALGTRDGCAYLVPERPAAGPPRYRCVTDHPAALADPEGVARRLDAALARAFQYRHARFLGQLDAAQVSYRADARAAYEARQVARGLSWGNVKFEALCA
jgi:hypothetical protein